MSFTISDQIAIGRYLGYPAADGFKQTIAVACAAVANLGAEYVIEAQGILRELASITEQINDARLGAGRSFQSGATGTAQYYRGDRLAELRSHGRVQVQLLAQQMNLNIYRDVFAASGGSGRVARG